MDIDNDGKIKETVQRWIKEGASSWLKSIPSWTEEVSTKWWTPYNIGQFEYNEVVKPFWDKYKHLSDEEFAEMWEKVRRDETYSFEEKYFDLAFGGVIEIFRPDIIPFRHGAGRYSKTNDPLGNRGKNHKLYLLKRNSVPGGKYEKGRMWKMRDVEGGRLWE